jgi:hypothetical protein
MALRGFLVDGKPDVAAKSFKEGVKNYPLAQAKNRGDGVHQHLEETDEHDPCEQLRVLRGDRACDPEGTGRLSACDQPTVVVP